MTIEDFLWILLYAWTIEVGVLIFYIVVTIIKKYRKKHAASKNTA